MEAAFLDRPLVKRSLVRRVGKEGIPPEHQPEHPEPVSPDIGRDGVVAIARHPENRRQIKLEELFGDRARARVVQTPAGAVRQNAPPELAGGLVVDAAEVAQHLRRGRGLLAPPPGATVQRSKPPFRFHDREAVLVALPLLGEAVRPVLRGAVGEQQSVRHVFASARREVLLPEAGCPAEPRQHRPDQVILGLALVGRQSRRKAVEQATQRGLEVCESLVGQVPPVRKLSDRFSKEVLGEQAPLEGPDHRHPRPPKPNSPESAWSSSAILSIVQSSSDSDPTRASKLAPTALERASSKAHPSLERSVALRSSGSRRRCRRRRPIPFRNPAGSLGKSPRFSELTPPGRGFSVYGMETPPTRDYRRRRPSGALAGELSGTLKVAKPAHVALPVPPHDVLKPLAGGRQGGRSAGHSKSRNGVNEPRSGLTRRATGWFSSPLVTSVSAPGHSAADTPGRWQSRRVRWLSPRQRAARKQLALGV